MSSILVQQTTQIEDQNINRDLFSINNNKQNDHDDDEIIHERGVLSLKHEQNILFSQELEIETKKLAQWKPHITLDERMLESEDE